MVSTSRTKGAQRVRRVLAIRPQNAPPTESLLETYMVQLLRRFDLPVFERQVEVMSNGRFVGRPDLALPAAGVFIELDGEHHKGQPRYDARRETAIVAATGWLPARFTWHEIVYLPTSTARRMRDVLEVAAQRSSADQ